MQVGEESKKKKKKKKKKTYYHKKKKKKKKSKNGERYSVGASFSLLFLERNVLTQEAFQRKLSGKRLSVANEMRV